MIELVNVVKRYPSGHYALKQINFKIKAGEFIFITGHSGAGKSSLIKLIALIERCTRGSIFFNQEELTWLHEKSVPFLRRQLGIIFQTPYLLTDKTIFDNVALPLIINYYGSREIPKRVCAALEMVAMSKKANCYPHELSAGEKQRVSIARAIVHKPQLLLADEPTGNLDPDLSQEIMMLFDKLNQVGVTVLVASHDLALIKKLNHPIITLSHGKIQESRCD